METPLQKEYQASLAEPEPRSLENPSTPITPAELVQIFGGGYQTAAGVTVNQDTALRFAAVFACVRNIAEDISSMPIDVVTDDGPQVRKVRPPRWLEYPNDEMTQQEWVENMLASALLDGNSYNQLVRDGGDNVMEVWPLNPAGVSARRDRNRRLVYSSMGTGGGTVELTGLVNSARGSVAYGDMLHMRAFRRPGAVEGLSVIEYCRQTIGVGMASQQFGAEFFGQGAHLSGVLSYPGALSVDAARVLLNSWTSAHQGLSNAHQPGVITEGATWTPISIPPDQAQFIATQEFSVVDIARMFRMPPHKIQDLTRATFSNIEHQAIEYVIDCLMTWVVRLQHCLTRLLPMGQRARVDVSHLLQGDMKTRFEAYQIARLGGWMNADDILAEESRNPLPNGLGSRFWRPLNMAEAGADDSSKGLLDKATAVLRLCQAGFDPAGVLSALGLPAIEHVETPATLPLPPDATAEPDPNADPTADPATPEG